MPLSELKQQGPVQRTNRRIGGSLILFILSAMLLLGGQGVTLYDRFARTTEVGLDNKVWVFAQLEVEAKNLSLALLEAMILSGPDGISSEAEQSIRMKFDIYYSRTQTVSSVAQDTFSDPEVLGRFEQLSRSNQQIAAMLDTRPRLVMADLLAIYALFHADMPDIRKVANAAMLDSILTAEATRESRHWIVGQLQILLGLVILLMIASVRQAMKVSRSVSHHATQTANVAARLRRTLNASLDAVLIVDSEGRITEYNAALPKILGGQSLETIVGKEAISFVAVEDRKAVLKLLASLRASAPTATTEIGTAQRTYVNLHLVDGTQVPVELSCAIDPSRDERSTFIVFIRDRSQEVAAADVLRLARDNARQEAKAKERFLSVLSHEMRTPLHGVITSLELMRSSEMNAEERGLLMTASACARSALTQVDDVLALTRNGYLGDPDEPFVPARLVDEIVSEVMPLALERGNRMTCKVSGESRGDAILAKHRSFKLTVRNLISNAVKYTSNGLIEVSLVAQPDPSGQVTIEVSVRDTGLGIDPAFHARVFDEFAMVAEMGADQKTGFGLGLAIAKSSVERLNGHIGLESSLGNGSTFHFSFQAPKASPQPLQLPEDPSPEQEIDPEIDSLQVMVVDDNPVNRALLCEMLKRLGHSAHMAQDGTSAISLAHEQPYDLILMDLSMPGLSGFEAARIIRAETRNRMTRILALTARDIAECKDDVRNSEMDGAYQKPISMSQLKEIIHQQAPHHVPASEGTDLPLLDGFQEVLGLMGREMTCKLSESMLHDSALAMKAMSAESSAPNAKEEIRYLAHRAGGSASVVGAARLGELWRSVELAMNIDDALELARLEEDIPKVYLATAAELRQLSIVKTTASWER